MVSNGKATEGLVQHQFGSMASKGKLLSWFSFFSHSPIQFYLLNLKIKKALLSFGLSRSFFFVFLPLRQASSRSCNIHKTFYVKEFLKNTLQILMDEIRNKNSYETLVYDFIKEVFVICPSCEKKALVKSEKFYDENVKLVCTNCGLNKTHEKEFTGRSNSKFSNSLIKNIVVIGGGIDPYFYLPLWLTTNVGENLFWAYNYEHLNFIKDFVSAKLRERNIENMSNKSLGSRLPKWITSHKNRELILKTIAKVEKK